jgi:hypothetical protein
MMRKTAKADKTAKTGSKAVTREYPKPYGTKAQNNKGNKMQAAHQKRNNQKGR